jgi:hypothetical protein
MPAWLEASVNVSQLKVTGCEGVIPGSIFELPIGRVTE